MAISSHNADLPETIDRARAETDELQQYNHTFQVLGYGVVDPDRLEDEYQLLVPQDEDHAVEMLEKQSEDVAEQWIDTHETVERELLYLFPKYENAFQEAVTGERRPESLEEEFNISPGMDTYHDTVGKVLQINHDYRVAEHMIEELSRSLESKGYRSPREIRIEEDRWYGNNIERVEQLDATPPMDEEDTI
jgi:uncharacterized protein YifE (UPF0438 family)